MQGMIARYRLHDQNTIDFETYFQQQHHKCSTGVEEPAMDHPKITVLAFQSMIKRSLLSRI